MTVRFLLTAAISQSSSLEVNTVAPLSRDSSRDIYAHTGKDAWKTGVPPNRKGSVPEASLSRLPRTSHWPRFHHMLLQNSNKK